MIKTFSLRSELSIQWPFNRCSSLSNPQLSVKSIKILSYGKEFKNPPKSVLPSKSSSTLKQVELDSRCQKPRVKTLDSENGYSRFVMMGAVSVGILLFLAGIDEQKALALGPEGPLVEEFWDNVRRYALYALTVSTGAIYTIFQPILELLKNPISAILILAIFGGSIYIVSQVLSAMVGVSDFSYEYGY